MMSEKEFQEIKNKIDETPVRVDEIDKKIMAFEFFNDLYEQINELYNYVCLEKDSKVPMVVISKKEVVKILLNYFLGEEEKDE